MKPVVFPIPRGLPWGAVIAAVALCAAIAAVYAPGLDAPFFMDDFESVAQSRSIRALPNLRDVLLYPNTNGKTVDGRPFLNLSLAINYSISGASPAGFRVGNVVIHCVNAVILAALLARLFASPSLPVIVRSHGGNARWSRRRCGRCTRSAPAPSRTSFSGRSRWLPA